MARLGRALLTAEHLDTAIEYYQRSIELDPNDGLVHAVLSFVFNLKNEYLNAIASSYRAMELFKKDIEANRSPSDPSLDNLSSLILRYKYLAELQKEIGQTEQAIKNYALALGQWTEEEVPNWPRRAWSFAFCFKELVMLGQYDCACKQLERFNSHPKRLDEDYMVIYDEMVIYNSTMERVGYGTRRPDLVDAFYANAIWTYAKYGEDYEVLALRYDRAKTILKLDSNKRQEAEGLFLEVIGREIIEDMPSFWGAYARNNAEKALGVIYLDNTLQAREDDDWIAVGKFAHKLVELVKDSQARRAANGGNPSDCVLILAAWARTHNRPGRTRELVREHLSLGVEMLSDDDENNDVEAWTYLCTALLVLGDNQLAQTALSAQLRLQLKDAITTTNEKHDAAEAGQTTDTTSENTLPVTYYWCDGPCFKGIPVQDRFYRCSYCVADLCLACYDKLMKDEMEGWHVCSKLHEQFLFDGVSEVYDANMVKVGDDLVPLSKWLDDLKVYYGLVEHGAKDGGHEGGQ
jgi:tetratricopeptide (TPR) repeat protein